MAWYKIDGLAVHIDFARGKKNAAPPQCRVREKGEYCLGMCAFLCDWPVNDEGETCDMPVCEKHAHQVGKNKHYCPRHQEMNEARQPRLPFGDGK